ncbi:hypothetical protein DM860_002098 [Cuscuta australis]|uniref:Uncharacterized protein n=1 Tax=Cuscuta australis TaxID=267555 RepID=A0A328DVQ8_9ASTE|nr:hypothetical protein DM860_002098 [Cuscuta australis]
MERTHVRQGGSNCRSIARGKPCRNSAVFFIDLTKFSGLCNAYCSSSPSIPASLSGLSLYLLSFFLRSALLLPFAGTGHRFAAMLSRGLLQPGGEATTGLDFHWFPLLCPYEAADGTLSNWVFRYRRFSRVADISSRCQGDAEEFPATVICAGLDMTD